MIDKTSKLKQEQVAVEDEVVGYQMNLE